MWQRGMIFSRFDHGYFDWRVCIAGHTKASIDQNPPRFSIASTIQVAGFSSVERKPVANRELAVSP
jgi:hypothetical protein